VASGTRRVVLNFGGSYSGATSAWFREKYPNVTHAAFSSSGVVNAILDMTAFDEQVRTTGTPHTGWAALGVCELMSL
jgi:hypothetical protein